MFALTTYHLRHKSTLLQASLAHESEAEPHHGSSLSDNIAHQEASYSSNNETALTEFRRPHAAFSGQHAAYQQQCGQDQYHSYARRYQEATGTASMCEPSSYQQHSCFHAAVHHAQVQYGASERQQVGYGVVYTDEAYASQEQEANRMQHADQEFGGDSYSAPHLQMKSASHVPTQCLQELACNMQASHSDLSSTLQHSLTPLNPSAALQHASSLSQSNAYPPQSQQGTSGVPTASFYSASHAHTHALAATPASDQQPLQLEQRAATRGVSGPARQQPTEQTLTVSSKVCNVSMKTKHALPLEPGKGPGLTVSNATIGCRHTQAQIAQTQVKEHQGDVVAQQGIALGSGPAPSAWKRIKRADQVCL